MTRTLQTISELPPLPPSRPPSSASTSRLTDDDDQKTIRGPPTPGIQSRRTSSQRPHRVPTSQLLLNLRHSFQQSEQSLYAQLSQTPTTNLNEVRRNFSCISKGARLRLSAWEKKHYKGRTEQGEVGKLETQEPEWWKPGCHAVPGGKVVVREGEWGSVIAFTLR